MKTRSLPLTILLTGLIAGTIDILSAIFILAGGNAAGVLKFVASGVFGKAAHEGGGEMIAAGLLFHYIIATCWTGGFILVYPYIPFLKWNKWVNAIAYGLFVQTLMRFIVLPLTNVGELSTNPVSFLKNAAILMYAIGLPAALVAAWHYGKNEDQSNYETKRY